MRDSIQTARKSGPSRLDDGSVQFEFCFAANDPVFAGHFPTRPILPAVFLLEITRAAAQWVLEHSLTVREIYKAKFTRPILPNDSLRLALKLSEADGGSLKARALFSVAHQRAGDLLLFLDRVE
jgi:3-hydroxymyristoyl/3-hydroxydecanoyl-(acyl carrier protein) dehydratase